MVSLASSLVLTSGLRSEALQHLTACLPEEGCGLLGGKDGAAEIFLPITNALHSPVRYRMDPLEQLRALKRLDSLSLDLLAILHSHPTGPPHPSPTDVSEFMYPGAVTLIASHAAGGWQLAAFLIENDSFMPVELQELP